MVWALKVCSLFAQHSAVPAVHWLCMVWVWLHTKYQDVSFAIEVLINTCTAHPYTLYIWYICSASLLLSIDTYQYLQCYGDIPCMVMCRH